MLRSQPTVHPANREVWLQLGGSSPPTRRPTIQPGHTNYPLVSVSTARGTECSAASRVNSFNELRQPSAGIDLGYIKAAPRGSVCARSGIVSFHGETGKFAGTLLGKLRVQLLVLVSVGASNGSARSVLDDRPLRVSADDKYWRTSNIRLCYADVGSCGKLLDAPGDACSVEICSIRFEALLATWFS